MLKTSPLWRARVLFVALLAVNFAAGAESAGASVGSGGRAYELVSPSDKNGGDIMPYTPRTRAARYGDAVAFASLVPFGDALGTGVAVEHMALRSSDGWTSHAITPRVDTGSLKLTAGTADTFYDNAFSPDFSRGVLVGARPVTSDPDVKDVVNLYRRTDLQNAGDGSYDLVTACPLCAITGTPLAPLPGISSMLRPFLPALAATSPDVEHIAFESIQMLTRETPPQTASCGTTNPVLPPSPLACAPHAYEWDGGALRLAGVLPDGRPADVSLAGMGARNLQYSPHVVSDGSDGHSRVFFTQPTDAVGGTFSDLDPSDAFGQLIFLLQQQGIANGNLYARIDHSATIHLNRSERGTPDAFAPAWYLDASVTGERVFFTTTQALTDDATSSGRKIYMYDMTKPDSAPDNLTLISPVDADSDGVWGVSDAGDYVYFSTAGGQVFLWHEGSLQDIGPTPGLSAVFENLVDGTDYGVVLRQARVTPDGRYLVFSSNNGSGFGGYDHGTCPDGLPCHELYLYSADSDHVVCVSCNPSGAPATASAVVSGGALNGGARVTTYLNRVITDDGSKVFFSTAEALVPQDTNGKTDAYQFDVAAQRVSLISTGKDPADSWFLDAGADGRDVFFATRQRLVGWDRDTAFDLYDARVGGGFSEPPPTPADCSGGACQGNLSPSPQVSTPASASFHGAGDARARLRARRASGRRRCKRGTVRRKVHGKRRCVKKRSARKTVGR